MKHPLLLLFILVSSIFSHLKAQDVDYKGKTYQVKGESIWLGSYDVTESLTFDDRVAIKEAYKIQESAYRKKMKARKQKDKAERKRRKQEQKAAKKAEQKYSTDSKQKKPKKFLIF